MKKFDQTSKGKKVKQSQTIRKDDQKDNGRGNAGAAKDSMTSEEDEADLAKVKEAREALKAKLNKSKTTRASQQLSNTIATEINPPTKEMRNWVSVSNKISKKDMEKIDVSKDKSGTIDIDKQKEIYLGGDDDELVGFYNSDDEIDFENFKKSGKSSGSQNKYGLFSKLTSALKNVTGNKVLTEEDIEPILK